MENYSYICIMRKELLNQVEQGKVCLLYKDENYSLQKIADLYSCSIKVITRILKKYSIKSRIHTRSLFDISYFRNIDTHSKAYFLGLLMADGCNYKEGFTLSLQVGDHEIIKKFKEDISFTGNINYRDHTNPKYKGIVRIKIHSKEISNQLSLLGIIPNKSLNTKFPSISEKLYSHFIRGVFDGDGCISLYGNNSCEFSIIGNLPLILKIQEILVEKCDIGKTKLINKKNTNKNIVSLKYGGKKNIIKIFNWLYKDCNNFYISRKFLKFKEIELWQSIKQLKKENILKIQNTN